MAQAPIKKTKAQRLNDIEKAREFLKKYSSIYFIENSDLPNPSVQQLRENINGNTLFVKKTMFQAFFPQIQLKENYFMIFTNDDIAEELKRFRYPTNLKAGEKIPETVQVKKGIVRKDKLIPYLSNTETKGANTVLLEDFTVCNAGDIATEDQAAMLKILGYKFGEGCLNILDVMQSADLKEVKK